MNEDLGAQAAAAAQDLRVAFNRLQRRMREVAASNDLTPPQVSALTRLDKGEVLTASGLAALERVRPQSMAATLAALEQRGLIRRDPDPSDGRRQLVTLTGAGRARVEGNRHAREEWLPRTMAQRYTREELASLMEAIALLDRLSEP